ncbi:hypothetical protein Glove_322g17 [Diversispora epigaea]|uniref:Uncharacterized protein n=1 Tax=Diversispora epigaea TaxID=1348612 RepID=A0A397HVD1_9GLOM|nr:hypothetical protein Glove_322g17 [Diversispora epigaea]
MTHLQNSKNLKYRDNLGGLCQICNMKHLKIYLKIKQLWLNAVLNLKRHLKRGFEKELTINSDGKVIHNSCISHCLLSTFGECNNKHENQCSKCDQFFDFFDFMVENIPEIVYLNVQFKATLSELNLDGTIIIADCKMQILPQPACETKQYFLESIPSKILDLTVSVFETVFKQLKKSLSGSK